MKHSDVPFVFLSISDTACVCLGTVEQTDETMSLVVPWIDGEYNIRGKKQKDGGFFCGKHEGEPGDVPVSAIWIQLYDFYIGTWAEGGIEYLFKFSLPENHADA